MKQVKIPKTAANALWTGYNTQGRYVEVARRASDNKYFARYKEPSKYGLRMRSWYEVQDGATKHPTKIFNPMSVDYDVPEYNQVENPDDYYDWGFKVLKKSQMLPGESYVQGIRLPI